MLGLKHFGFFFAGSLGMIFISSPKIEFQRIVIIFSCQNFKIKYLAIFPYTEEKNTLGISVFFAIIFQRKEKLLLHLVIRNST
jgi:hypothetical protein